MQLLNQIFKSPRTKAKFHLIFLPLYFSLEGAEDRVTLRSCVVLSLLKISVYCNYFQFT